MAPDHTISVWVARIDADDPTIHVVKVEPVSSRQYAKAKCGATVRFGGTTGIGGVMLPLKHALKFGAVCVGCFADEEIQR